MGTTRYASVLGLGFGDCGKGHFVDALTRRWCAHTVVRCNGGAQAGHNVVTSGGVGSAERHHTFSQFGAGTLVPGTRTLLLDPMVVHPTALLVEAEALGRIGIHDALSRLTIDAQCRVTTPYHQAAGRLRERLRGAAAHGTCGVGVGETVRHGLEYPDQIFRYADLLPGTTAHSKAPLDRLQSIRETLLAEFSSLCAGKSEAVASDEFRALQEEKLGLSWLTIAQAVARQCPPLAAEPIRDQLLEPGCVLFEGAQGVLLDEWRGFHPHTTWSTISTAAVDSVAGRFGITGPIEHYGVLRSYLTRHGAGPLPTHDESLDEQLPEPHNHAAGWQGQFRRGHPDAVLLRYALEAVGPLTGLLVSHLDIFQRGVSLKWCERYFTAKSPCVESLPLSANEDLTHQAMLTELLMSAQPRYATESINSAEAFIERMREVTSLPVLLRSYGATSGDIRD
ncbi:MAG TPA: adenylosuccinate synthetase [Chthoniobacter sp.]|nr:adenylosuccinate synthetase [Chthoniobacter sp.]